jgi:hypothetical protein
VLVLTLAGTLLLALLAALPFLGDLSSEPGSSSWITALAAGATGLAVGWLLAVPIGNGYARNTLGLTPLRITPRLVCAILATCMAAGLLVSRRNLHWSWTARWVAMVLVLALCAGGLTLIGAVSESLNLSLSEAERMANDWITVSGAPANGQLVRDAYLLPGIRGYAIEAYGGPANETESRWTGPWPHSGVLYGVHLASSEKLGSNPYRVGYWRGRALSPKDAHEAVVGYDLAQARGWQVGDTVDARGTSLVIVGILAHVPYSPSSDVNYRVEVNLDTLRGLLHQPGLQGELTLLIPPARDQAQKSAFLSEASVRLRVDAVSTVNERLAQIACSYPAAWALSSAGASDVVRHARAVYVSFALLCHLALLAVGALTVMGAFSQRLVEEERQIGLLQAFGADEGSVFSEYLQQAIALGALGGLLGVLAGWVISSWLDGLGPAQSAELLFTPRLAAGVFFALVLATLLSAIVPASRAVRASVVRTLYATQDIALPVAAQVTPGGLES